jgi:hypothetical protein
MPADSSVISRLPACFTAEGEQVRTISFIPDIAYVAEK